MTAYNLVTFQHDVAVCPVRQPTPEAARSLSQSLTNARNQVGPIPGAFLPPDHRGAAVIAGDPDVVRRMFQDVLSYPPHYVQVHPVADVDKLQLTAIAVDPTLLEGSSDAAVMNRALLFHAAELFAPEVGYGDSLAEGTPSLSLIELEEFLSDKADEIAKST